MSEKEKIELQKERVAARNKPLVLHKTWFEKWNPYRLQAPKPRSSANSHTLTDANLETLTDEAANGSTTVSLF
jgi:hypothetical protein